MGDPRNCCTKATARESQLVLKRKGIFDAARSLGGLEVLNKVGHGKVREGLETLARVSDSIRSGKSVVPGREGDSTFNTTLGSIAGTARDSIENGANAVLDATGLGRGALDAINGIDANVANRALGSAKQIFQQVKQGNFKTTDIPGVFQNLQNLEILARSIFTPAVLESSQIQGLNASLCRPSPFAVDLIRHSPRFKFMYIVDIKFAPAYQVWNAQLANGLSFITKSSSRPGVTFEYDDVNMYNHWTKVAKRTVFNPVTMRFIDDNTNFAMNFYAAYLRAMSPITNKKFLNDRGNGHATNIAEGTYESDSMNFNEEADDLDLFGTRLRSYSSGLGPLNNDINGNATKTLLSSISLYHLGNHGGSVTAFHMFNPKITQLTPDEVDMADNGNGSEFTFEFAYDSLFIDPNIDIHTFGVDKVSNLTDGGQYPLNIVPAPETIAGGNNKGLYL